MKISPRVSHARPALKQQTGFTLVELLVVAAIIAIYDGLTVSYVENADDQPRVDSIVCSDSGYELSGGLAVGMTKEDVRHIMGTPSRSTALEDEYAGENRKGVVFVYENNRVIRIRAGSFAE